MEVDVLCTGYASYDLIFTVERHPDADEKCFASGFAGAGGGPASNAAVAVARAEGRAAFAGYLGSDAFGGLHLEELRAEGVLTELVVRGAHPTALSAIIVKPDGKRAVVAHRAATPFLLPHQADFSRISPKVMLFDGHEPAISLPAALEARRKNIPVVLDAGSVHKGTRELAPLADYLVASEKFAREFTGKTDLGEALRSLAQKAPVAVITMGEAGLVWASPQADGRLDAFPVKAVDSTGAGDILHGVFALRLAKGDGLEAALRYASAAAALGCTRTGARAGIPGRQEIELFLAGFATEG